MTAIESTALQARLAVEADELLRPGVVRVSFAYATSYSSFRYIVRAFLWIATHGAALLGWYAPDERTGEWRQHRAGLRGALTAGAEVDVTGRVGAAREVIKASTIDEANGLVLSDASRGAQRAQPRRWLSAVEFGDTGAKIPMVSLRADTRSVVSEATLFDAYLVEADALLVGLAKSDAPIVHASAGLLSAEGASLRWFALDDAPCAPWRLDETLHCIPADEVAADVARLSARVRNILGGDNAILPDISAWDGGVILESPTNSSSSETSSPTEEDRAKETCVNVVTAAKKVGKIFTLPRALSESAAATSAIAQSKEACGADDNDEDSDAGEDDWRVVRAATATFTAAARAEAALPPRLTPLEFAARRSRLAETAAALVAVTGAPPQALVRTLAHGLKEAISQYRMIRHGDRILVGLSGGKDSMTMLLQLLRLQAIAPIYFEIGAATVDPQYAGFDPSPLQAWTASIGVPFSFESLDVVSLAKEKMGADSLCAFCSRLKRGLLYSACRRRGYNVLALGQHLDDFAESFVMSAFKNGVLRTMKAHYTNDAGDIRIIRPLCLLREKATRAFADACALPVMAENCPACFTGPTARYLTKRLLAREEASNSALYPALLSAMRPLMTTRGSTQVLSAAATTISNQDLAIAPKGFVPAALGGEPTDGTVGGTV
jgi:tRNA 2-thiocytidine biosynthesis protein TtcA